MIDIRVPLLSILALVASGSLPGSDSPATASARLAHLTATSVPAETPSRAPAELVPADLVEKVRRLDQRSGPLKDFRARLAVNLKKGDRDYSLSGMYTGSANGDFRLSMNWGIVSILDVAFHGDQVELWLPRKGKLCLGNRSLVEEIPNELRLLERIGSVSDLFFPIAWSPHAIARRLQQEENQYVLNVIAKENDELLPARRVYLGSYGEHCVVTKTVLYEKGSPIGAVEFRDYYEISGWLIPRTVEVWASTTTRIVLTIEGIAINTQRPLELKVQAPSGAKEADLAETLKAGKLLE